MTKADARRRAEETENERLYAAAREVDRIAHHEVHHLEAMAGVIKRYAADAIAQAVHAERESAEKFYDQMARDYVADVNAALELAHAHAEAMRAIPYDEFAAEEACARFEDAYAALRANPTEPTGEKG